MFGGKITFKSKFEVGSCFTFTFKLEEEQVELSDQEQEEEFQINSKELVFAWEPDNAIAIPKYVIEPQVVQRSRVVALNQPIQKLSTVIEDDEIPDEIMF